jgi:hypothetical protein
MASSRFDLARRNTSLIQRRLLFGHSRPLKKSN